MPDLPVEVVDAIVEEAIKIGKPGLSPTLALVCSAFRAQVNTIRFATIALDFNAKWDADIGDHLLAFLSDLLVHSTCPGRMSAVGEFVVTFSLTIYGPSEHIEWLMADPSLLAIFRNVFLPSKRGPKARTLSLCFESGDFGCRWSNLGWNVDDFRFDEIETLRIHGIMDIPSHVLRKAHVKHLQLQRVSVCHTPSGDGINHKSTLLESLSIDHTLSFQDLVSIYCDQSSQITNFLSCCTKVTLHLDNGKNLDKLKEILLHSTAMKDLKMEITNKDPSEPQLWEAIQLPEVSQNQKVSVYICDYIPKCAISQSIGHNLPSSVKQLHLSIRFGNLESIPWDDMYTDEEILDEEDIQLADYLSHQAFDNLEQITISYLFRITDWSKLDEEMTRDGIKRVFDVYNSRTSLSKRRSVLQVTAGVDENDIDKAEATGISTFFATGLIDSQYYAQLKSYN